MSKIGRGSRFLKASLTDSNKRRRLGHDFYTATRAARRADSTDTADEEGDTNAV